MNDEMDHGTIIEFDGMTPRECLIAALAKAIPDGDKHARDLIDALDVYLAEDETDRAPRRPSRRCS